MTYSSYRILIVSDTSIHSQQFVRSDYLHRVAKFTEMRKIKLSLSLPLVVVWHYLKKIIGAFLYKHKAWLRSLNFLASVENKEYMNSFAIAFQGLFFTRTEPKEGRLWPQIRKNYELILVGRMLR